MAELLDPTKVDMRTLTGLPTAPALNSVIQYDTVTGNWLEKTLAGLGMVHTDISDFDAGVQANRLDQMAAPIGSVSLNSQKITDLLAPTLDTDAANKKYVDDNIVLFDTLAELTDVTITTRAANQVLVVNGGNTVWINALLVNANIDAGAAITATKIHDGSVDNTEFGYLNGVTSAIQTQIDSKLADSLTDAFVFVGNVGNLPIGVAITGDIGITNAGVTSISTGVIIDADINVSAAIAYSKLASLTSGNILVGSVGNVATSITMSGDATIIASGAITITNDAVTLAKLAAGTAGNLISYDPSGDPVAVATGTATHVLTSNGVGLAPTFQALPAPAGDVVGPASSTDHAIARFDLATGKLLQNSVVLVGDAGNITGLGTLNTHTIPGGTSTFAILTDKLSVFAATTSAELAGVISDETGSGLLVFGTSPTLVTPALGTPSALVLTNATGLPPAGVTGVAAVKTDNLSVFAATTSAQLLGVISDEVGTGALVFGTAPVIDSASLSYAMNAQVGTTYTPVLLDAGKVITTSNASPVVVTIPPNSSVAYPIGSSITVVSIGAGLTNFAIGSGVTINSVGAVPAAPVLRAQYSAATALKTATDTWVVFGDIT